MSWTPFVNGTMRFGAGLYYRPTGGMMSVFFTEIVIDGGVAYAKLLIGCDHASIIFGTHNGQVASLYLGGGVQIDELVKLAQAYLNSIGTWGEFVIENNLMVVTADDESVGPWDHIKVTSDQWMMYLPERLESLELKLLPNKEDMKAPERYR